MPKNKTRKTPELIRRIIAQAQRRLTGSKRVQLVDFIRRYYANVPPQDIASKAPADLFGAAMAHWKLAAQKAPGEARVRVYNPNVKDHGWASGHTVIEVVNDDMPFLVDSVAAEINRQDMTVHLIVHPIFEVRRGKGGRLLGLAGEGQPITGRPAKGQPKKGRSKKGRAGAASESFMHLEITEQPADRLDDIRDGVLRVMADVRAAVEDWRLMRAQMKRVIGDLEIQAARRPTDEAEEVRAFLEWIHDDQFTFLGYREYRFTGGQKSPKVSVNRRSGLGILRDADRVVFEELRGMASMPNEVRALIHQPDLLMVTKINRLSPVHRPVHMDSIGIKRFDAKGRAIGQHVFIGLFTSTAYNRTPSNIPLLRRKLHRTMERAGFPRASHDGKTLMNILANFPRDELFQVSEEHLFNTAMGILHLQGRQRVALFVRRDDFERFISCLVYVPRDLYTTDLRRRMQDVLCEAFAGKVTAHYATLGDDPLARLHLIIGTTPGAIPDYDPAVIEARLVETARSWVDRLQDALVEAEGEEKGMRMFRRYQSAFKSAYKERFDAPAALIDIRAVDETLATGELAMNLHRPVEADDHKLWFKVYHPGAPIPLSDILPMLEHMGLRVIDEIPYVVRPENLAANRVFIHDFGLLTGSGGEIDLGEVRENFEETFRRVWRGEMESDGFNQLALTAGLSWRGVVVLRAYFKYLLQTGITFSQAYMEQTLSNNPRLTRMIVDLFLTRMDPAGAKGADARARKILDKINRGLEEVASADEDRIIRRFLNLVESTLRTNFFQKADDGAPKPHLSFKLDSQKLDDLPLPRPMMEIWVYSPRMEGVHLRFGKVARGGLRWSDRREDFRTEILGLVKAQQVKNAVIVPVGSKGGFVLKRPPAGGGREALQEEGIACYRTLITGMLDLTDNLTPAGKVRPPKDVVRRDDDDPYLVVAADKGTATFSDIANGISRDYGFWLGDAFASGGSVGYDHKKMGITARGAWESVKRHFREMDMDIQAQDFTVAGVGDMSGDVFGNGMLLSPHIKLVAAFNHMHIFIDPDPDPAKSLAERWRLFGLPRSSWADFDTKVLSRGGGVYERSAKSLNISAAARKLFGLEGEKITPNDLLQAILTAPVDLLWFGGIGTYVKASHESHGEVGDRANDAIRADARDLRCKVIGEGANLGMTQPARIEYGLRGGRLNTDSVDNSAGVDCSDHEVNIKILLDSLVVAGTLTPKQRVALLARMTDEVGDLVLRDNYLQTQAISTVEMGGIGLLDEQTRLMHMMERAGRLDRAVEFLPDDETLAERAARKQGLTRPEVAVLLSYAKIWLFDELMQSGLPDDPYMTGDLIAYFPTPLGAKYEDAIMKHRLKREIIATGVTNSLINRVGGRFVNQFVERTGMWPGDIARAYVIARQVCQLRGLWNAIEALDNKVPTAVQTRMQLTVNHLIRWTTLWFLRNCTPPLDIGPLIGEFTDGIAQLSACLTDVLPAHYKDDLRTRAQPYLDAGVPEDLALSLAGLVNLYSGCDIVRLAAARRLKVRDVARLYFAVGTRFRLGTLRGATNKLDSPSHWTKMAVAALIEDLYGHQLALTRQVLDHSGNQTDPRKAMAVWTEKNRIAIDRADAQLKEIRTTKISDLSIVSIASRQLRALSEPQG